MNSEYRNIEEDIGLIRNNLWDNTEREYFENDATSFSKGINIHSGLKLKP